MKEIYEKMSLSENQKYKEYIQFFVGALKPIMGLEPQPENFYVDVKERIEGYIKLMNPYIPELSLPEGDEAIRFFIVKEINRLYSQR